jgi:hypothetical protein
MNEIGSQWIIEGHLPDGTPIYWSKTQDYVTDPKNATFCKNKKKAETEVASFYMPNSASEKWTVREVKLMLV